VKDLIKKGDTGGSEQKRLQRLNVFGGMASTGSVTTRKDGTGGMGELRREEKYQEIGSPGMDMTMIMIWVLTEIKQENVAGQEVGRKSGPQCRRGAGLAKKRN
jgi:hypothetical protein